MLPEVARALGDIQASCEKANSNTTFLKLPAEIRLQIYHHVIVDQLNKGLYLACWHKQHFLAGKLLKTCRQICFEATPVFYYNLYDQLRTRSMMEALHTRPSVTNLVRKRSRSNSQNLDIRRTPTQYHKALVLHVLPSRHSH